jgi:hypothetical protein
MNKVVPTVPTEASLCILSLTEEETHKTLSEADGTKLGESLMARITVAKAGSSRKNRSAIVERATEAFLAENGIARKYLWFKFFLKPIIRNSLQSRSSVSTKLEQLSEEEARKIGSSLPIAILTNINAEAGVDEWIALYPALVELDDELPWFRSMMNSIALRLLKDGDFGLKARVSIGASLSYFDMASDCFMIYRFASSGKMFYAYGTLASICVNLCFQCYMVFVSNHKRDKKVLARELLMVLTFTKPAVDAFRIWAL